jgi:predicted DNA-binding transcriptional regulator AlpA
MDNNQLPQFANERQVAEYLSVSVAAVRRWRLLRKGPKYLKIGAAVRYKSADVEAFINSRPTGGGQ